MKIVKSFEDEEFFEKYHNDHGIQDDAYKQKGNWYWGLNSDGHLCYHSTVYQRTDEVSADSVYDKPVNWRKDKNVLLWWD